MEWSRWRFGSLFFLGLLSRAFWASYLNCVCSPWYQFNFIFLASSLHFEGLCFLFLTHTLSGSVLFQTGVGVLSSSFFIILLFLHRDCAKTSLLFRTEWSQSFRKQYPTWHIVIVKLRSLPLSPDRILWIFTTVWAWSTRPESNGKLLHLSIVTNMATSQQTVGLSTTSSTATVTCRDL